MVDAGTGSGAIALALATELGPRRRRPRCGRRTPARDALEVAAPNSKRVRAGFSRRRGADSPDGARWAGEGQLARAAAREAARRRRPRRVEPALRERGRVARPGGRGPARAPRPRLVAGAASDGTAGLADVEAVLRSRCSVVAASRRGGHRARPAPGRGGGGPGAGLGYDETRVELDLAGRPRALVAGPASREEAYGGARRTAGTSEADHAVDLDLSTGEIAASVRPASPSSTTARARPRRARRSSRSPTPRSRPRWPKARSWPCPGSAGTASPCGSGRRVPRPGSRRWRPTPTGRTTPSATATTCAASTSGWTDEVERLLERCWPGPVDVLPGDRRAAMPRRTE